MLKKKVMLAGLMLAVVSMMAYAGERGATPGTGTSMESRVLACENAKESVRNTVRQEHPKANVTGYSSCDCSSEKLPVPMFGHTEKWTCAVDANWEEKDKD
jgi:hypothetical protein